MGKPVFTNRPNQVVHLSRSVAVMVVPVFRRPSGTLWVPLGQRSNKVSDAGKWCLPCGYLDWDESLCEAAIRETYEEIGLDLSGLLPDQAWFTQSDPQMDKRQNVTHRFGCIIDVDELPDLTIDHIEVVAAEWCKVADAVNRNDLAFNHASIIREFVAHLMLFGA